MKYLVITLTLASILILNTTQSYAGWLFYHKSGFKGKVIDADTKEPIEGAVVVVAYQKSTYDLVDWKSNISVIEVKETLTDKSGLFHIPSYTTLLQPMSTGSYATFIIYKPGYGNYPKSPVIPHGIFADDVEKFFSKETGSTGKLDMFVKDEKGFKYIMSEFIFGIVELSKSKSKEDSVNTMPSPVSNIENKKQQLFIQLLNEERKSLGLAPI